MSFHFVQEVNTKFEEKAEFGKLSDGPGRSQINYYPKLSKPLLHLQVDQAFW